MAEKLLLLVFIFHGGTKVSKKSGHVLRNVSNLLAKPIIPSRDFNNPAGREGYQTILASPLKLQDSFQVAQNKWKLYSWTWIDGWKGNEEPLRIDCFCKPRVG